jgi:TP901 family phage tail tape measure protein
MEFSRAADIATDVMGAFRLRTGDVEQDLIQLTRVNDVLSKAVNMSNVDMENLFETIKFAGPVAKTAGVSLEKFSAMAAFIGGAGIKGSLGGTALRTMFISLAAPTKKAITQFKKLGIEVQTSTGDLRDPIEVLKDLSVGFKDMGKAQQTAALNLIFGRRAVSGAAVSVDGATKALGKFEESLKNSNGNAKKLAEFMRTSMKKRLAELKSAAIEVGFKFIDSFEKKMPGAVDKLVNALRNIDVKVIIDDIRKLAGFASDVVGVLKEYAPIIKAIGAAWVALKIGAVIKAVAILAIKFKALVAVAGGLLPALTALLGPIGAIAAAVFGLGAAIFTVIDRWDELTASWMVDDMKNALSSLLDHPFFMAVGTILAPWIVWPAKILKEWEPIVEFFKELIIDIKNATNAAFEFFGLESPFKKQIKAPIERIALPGDERKSPYQPLVKPPNEAQEEARKTAFLKGTISLAGAPKGSKFEMETRNAPPIKTEILGDIFNTPVTI